MTSFYGEYRDRQKDIISDEEENQVSRANVDKWIFRLFLILIGFMPLIVLGHTKDVISPLVSDVSLLTSGTKGDLFTYYKAFLVLLVTIIAGLLLLIKIFFMNGKIKKTILNYFLGIFTFAIVMSTIFSPNISIALSGQYNRNDGAISWLCYIALMFIAMNINYPKKAVNYIMFSLYPFVFINLYIITMNFTGNDLMQNKWVQTLVSIALPDGSSFSAGSQIVGTLNQWNYMSGMFAILTVMFLVWAIVEGTWIKSIISVIVATLSITVMFMSISTSGFVTLLVMVPIIIVSVIKAVNKIKGTVILALFLLISASVLHVLASENSRVWDESLGFLIKNNPYLEEQAFSKITSSFELGYMNEVSAADNSFVLPVLPERGVSAGTGRLYIWEKTIDVFKDRPIFGYGLDSLMYNFPHFNIDARSGNWDENIITDKPHNIFLGILYGTGLVGFIGFLLLFVSVVVYSVTNLFKKIYIQNIVLVAAVLAYFVQSMFNDSLPGTSAIAWILIGMVFGIHSRKKHYGRNIHE
ncbi:O-antigen ligase family protein [Lysinibacillus telephonicus]|uniref:O-antigen ligase-related domain-containing protein n=1 Tax=Lysinibacillus telephonicus TaxID=1714840 RepID=A0A3S0JPS8_9BACI|nr:O-antigen ligase family protein [Lysinibacillus telephonicus]RTQ93150.1 hypothetical protein EKG35_09465 [Lysinibacillus telephonicus]